MPGGLLTKSMGGFAVVLILTAVTAIYALVNLQSMETLGTRIYTENLVPVRSVSTMRANLGVINSMVVEGMIKAAVTPNLPSSTSSEVENAITHQDQLENGFAPYADRTDEQLDLARYRADWRRYQDAIRGVVSQAASHHLAAASASYFKDAVPLQRTVDTDLDTLGALEQRLGLETSQSITDTFDRTRLVTILLLLVTLVVTSAIAYAVVGEINQSFSPPAE